MAGARARNLPVKLKQQVLHDYVLVAIGSITASVTFCQPPILIKSTDTSHRKAPVMVMSVTLRRSSLPALLGTTAVFNVPVSTKRRYETYT